MKQESTAEGSNYAFKVLLIGDTSVGKSSLAYHFAKETSMNEENSMLNIEFFQKSIDYDGDHIMLRIWEIIGKNIFHSLSPCYYKDMAGVLILYDISRKDTFSNVGKWLNNFREFSDERASIILVGNKSDMKENRQVSEGEGIKFAEENKIHFIETSAKTGENVKEAFQLLLEEIHYKIKQKIINPEENIHGVRIMQKENDSSISYTKSVFRLSGIFTNTHQNNECWC